MSPTRTEKLGDGAEVRGLLLGPISPALFLDVFLTEGVDHDASVETIKQRILTAKEGAGRGGEPKVEQTMKRKEISGEDRNPKRPRIEGSSESTPPLTEKDTPAALVGSTLVPSRLPVTHLYGHKAQAPAIKLWDSRICEHLQERGCGLSTR